MDSGAPLKNLPNNPDTAPVAPDTALVAARVAAFRYPLNVFAHVLGGITELLGIDVAELLGIGGSCVLVTGSTAGGSTGITAELFGSNIDPVDFRLPYLNPVGAWGRGSGTTTGGGWYT